MGFTGYDSSSSLNLYTFFDDLPNSYSSASHTKLTQLILSSTIHFEQDQIIKLLGLDKSNSHHLAVYTHLQKLIKHTIIKLDQDGKCDFLNAPLSNIQFVSFIIAKQMSHLFLVPVKKKYNVYLEDANQWDEDGCVVFTWACRFNENWLITYLLKQEYLSLRNQQSSKLLSG